MSDPGEHLTEESQSERGAPGSRDTGSDQASGGPTDRPSGSIEGDESVPDHGDQGKSGATASEKTEHPPTDAKPAVPPYEGRQTAAKPEGDEGEGQGARTGGAVKPESDSGYKSQAPDQTAGGATASPADEQPASQTPETQTYDDMVGPGHTPGTGKGERKL
jgi:hypothetical protein